ncbi:hypothetical protein [Faecalicoccus acidiformans]|uniref:DUF2232 domain-containing protein n=1 Tax=Faecalicoccus acidiformans TaxID=915173 RepID=A0ABS2FKN1_9FIRM|nr:hypothetical protein [Faecalicoccus acidiformans]MBM6830578.1 hypothetical protein [Faecalicoccus acidiformans]
MKTSTLTQGAFCLSVYGVLLLFNQQNGLLLESMLNWVFIIPIMIFTAKAGPYPGAITGLSMAILSFLFGTFTTWFYSWSAILIGFFYGVGVYNKISHSINFLIALGITLISYVFMIYLWAGIFGMDLSVDFVWISRLIPFLDFQAFCFLFALFISFVQTLCIHMLGLLLCVRLKIPMRKLGSLRSICGSKPIGIGSLLIAVFFFFGQNVIEYSIWLSAIQILFFIDLGVLDFLGTVYLMEYGIIHRIPKFTILAVLGAFIPILNIFWMLLGLSDCLLELRKDKI